MCNLKIVSQWFCDIRKWFLCDFVISLWFCDLCLWFFCDVTEGVRRKLSDFPSDTTDLDKPKVFNLNWYNGYTWHYWFIGIRYMVQYHISNSLTFILFTQFSIDRCFSSPVSLCSLVPYHLVKRSLRGVVPYSLIKIVEFGFKAKSRCHLNSCCCCIQEIVDMA